MMFRNSKGHEQYTSKLAPVSDTNWFFSPYNWCFPPGDTSAAVATTINNGAYFRVGFSGRSAAVHFDTSALRASNVPLEKFHTLLYRIDRGGLVNVKLPPTSLTVASELDPTRPHELELIVCYNELFMDRWKVPGISVTVTGLELDANAKTLPTPARDRRVLVYGDSLGDGYGSFVCYMCELLDVEYGVAAFRGLGWMCGVHPDVPAFLESWSSYFAGSSRLTNGTLQPPPDLICVALGTNDHFEATNDDALMPGVINWLREARSAAPNADIAVTIPFGGFKREALTAAVRKYASISGDRRVHLVDLGPEAERGLNSPGAPPNELSHDGIHPQPARQKVLGEMLGRVLEPILKSRDAK